MPHGLVIPAYLPRRSTRSRTCSISAIRVSTEYDGGFFQQADEENFPILKGQEASIVKLTLQPGGIREPHWHPSAWEINLVTSGVAAWVVIDGNGNHEKFDQHVGDVVFAPQGSIPTTSKTGARPT